MPSAAKESSGIAALPTSVVVRESLFPGLWTLARTATTERRHDGDGVGIGRRGGSCRGDRKVARGRERLWAAVSSRMAGRPAGRPYRILERERPDAESYSAALRTPAAWIACHTAAGVAGMSRCVTPSGESA